MSNYSDLLKHPLWQKKRLEIMSRDGFKCMECKDQDTTLNVHHNYYIDGNKPWEYEDTALSTLCEPCHKKMHALEDALKAFGLYDLFGNENLRRFGIPDLVSVIGNVFYAISQGAEKKDLLKMIYFDGSSKVIDKQKLYKKTLKDLEEMGCSEDVEYKIIETELLLMQLREQEANNG